MYVSTSGLPKLNVLKSQNQILQNGHIKHSYYTRQPRGHLYSVRAKGQGIKRPQDPSMHVPVSSHAHTHVLTINELTVPGPGVLLCAQKHTQTQTHTEALLNKQCVWINGMLSLVEKCALKGMILDFIGSDMCLWIF